MIKVLECGVSCMGGGIENYVFTQYREFDKTKIHVDFINIYRNQKMAYADEIISNGSVIYDIHDNKAWNKFFKEHHGEYEIIVFNTANPIFLPLWRAKKKGGFKKVIVHSHNSAHSLPWYMKMFTPLTDRYLKAKIRLLKLEKWACSEDAGRFMFGNKDEFEVIKNAIDIDKYKYNPVQRIEKRRELNVSNDTIVVGMIGRISYQKNNTFGIAAFDRFCNLTPNSVLVIIGGISEQNELKKVEKAITETNGDVRYLGLQEDSYNWYNAFDLFLFPSRFEGFSLVGLEVQVSGVPSIFSNTITPSAIISDTVVTLPITEDSETFDKWAQEMNNRLKMHNIRSERYKEIIEEGYDIASETRRVEKLLESYCK